MPCFLIPGIAWLCSSNGVRNEARILEIFSDHGPITIIPTYRLEHLEQNLNSVHQNCVFIHTLTNNVPGSRNLVVLAKKFCQICLEFRARRPNTRIFVSLLLPRFDNVSGIDVVNREIINSLGHFQNIFLIPNSNFDESDFIFDKLHLSPNSFEKLASNWLKALGNSGVAWLWVIQRSSTYKILK